MSIKQAPDLAAIDASILQGPVRVLAGPGTGKTHTLVSLYAQLVEQGIAGRSQILVLTFSTNAAEELARRIDERLHDSYDQAWISTFHSFCARLLRNFKPDPGRLLLSGFQEWVAMKAVLAEVEGARLGSLARVRGSDTFAQDALALVALLKQNLVHPASFALLAEASGTARLRALAAIFSSYQARLEAAGLVDFRDLVAESIGLLGSSPKLLDRLRARFTHVLVDEFQDVDPAQFELLRLLAPPADRPRLLVVGDADQSIYGFRGTMPRLLSEEFPRAYSPSTVEMDLCRRCPAGVLQAAEQLLEASIPGRIPRRLQALQRGLEPSVTVSREANPVDEAFFVAREIRHLLIEAGGSLHYSDFAILLRSTTTLSAPFEEALRALRLPYEVRGLGAMARNEVVRFLLGYLRALAQPDDEAALPRVLSSSLSGVSQRALSRVRVQAREEGREPIKVIRRVMYRLASRDPGRFPLPWGGEPLAEAQPQPPDPPMMDFLSEDETAELHAALATFYRLRRRCNQLPLAALAYAVLIEAGVLRRLLDLPLPDSERLEALADLRAAIDAFNDLEQVSERLAGSPPSLAEVAPRLDTLLARAVDDAQPARSVRDAVQILTVHQAKGLEFEVVFLSGFAHGIFPVQARPHPLLDEADRDWLEKSIAGFRPSWPADPEFHLAEEARLAYVGMTRPRRHLYLTYADEYHDPAGPSAFLEAAGSRAQVRELTRSAEPLDPVNLLTRSEAETLLAQASGSIEPGAAAQLRSLGVDMEFVLDPASGRPFWPFETPPPEANPASFSPTAITDYLKCPRIYWYRHHPGLAAVPVGPEARRGAFLHRVLEDFHRREQEWRFLPAEAQRAWLESAVTAHLEVYLTRMEAVLDRKREEQEVRRILDNYMRFATSMQRVPRRGTLATEKRFRLDFEGHDIHGVIDRINDTGNGSCEVVDYKTGRGFTAPRAYESYFGSDMWDVQMALYYLACRSGIDEDGNRLALEPRFLSLWYPKDMVYGSMRQVLFAVGEPAGLRPWQERPLSEEDLARGRRVVADAIAGIRSGDFSPRPRDVTGTCINFTGCAHALVCPFARTAAE